MPHRHAPISTLCQIRMHLIGPTLQQARELLRSAIEPIQAKPGCLRCHALATAAGTPGEEWLEYIEEWTDEAAFQRHVRSEEFLRVLLAMDLCVEPPAVNVAGRTGEAGMAYLRQLRCGAE